MSDLILALLKAGFLFCLVLFLCTDPRSSVGVVVMGSPHRGRSHHREMCLARGRPAGGWQSRAGSAPRPPGPRVSAPRPGERSPVDAERGPRWTPSDDWLLRVPKRKKSKSRQTSDAHKNPRWVKTKKLTGNVTVVAQTVRKTRIPLTRAVSLSARTGPRPGEDRCQPGGTCSGPVKQAKDSSPELVRSVRTSTWRHRDSGTKTARNGPGGRRSGRPAPRGGVAPHRPTDRRKRRPPTAPGTGEGAGWARSGTAGRRTLGQGAGAGATGRSGQDAQGQFNYDMGKVTELTSAPGETRPGPSPPSRLAVGAASCGGPRWREAWWRPTPCEGETGDDVSPTRQGLRAAKAPRPLAPGGPEPLVRTRQSKSGRAR